MAFSTVSEAIVNFIESYGSGIKVDVNHITDGSDKYGLFKSPSRSLSNYIDSSYDITENYQFLIRKDAIENGERIDAEEFLESLQYWVDDYAYTYAYPELTNDREITNIALTACPYPMDTTEYDILYQVTLQITYTRLRQGD